MERRILGGTGLSVSALGFGGAEIGFESAAPETVERLLHAALDAGLNMIDTAECYASSDGAPSSEELIGRALSGRRDQVVLCTKCGHSSGLPFPDWDPKLLAASIDRSLKRLRTDHVDLIQLHSCSEEILRQGDVIRVLQDARAAGKTRYIGYSGDNEHALYAVECGAFDTLQTSVNIADQLPITLTIPKAHARGMGVIAKRPVANVAWALGDNPSESNYGFPYWKRLNDLNYAFLRTDEAVNNALRFTLAIPGVHTAIVGTKNPDRWASNAAHVADGPLGIGAYDGIRARWAEVAGDDWVGQT